MATGRKRKEKYSKVWYHFPETSEGKAKCAYCGTLTSIVNGSTGNLRRHLRLKHPELNIDNPRSESYFIHQSDETLECSRIFGEVHTVEMETYNSNITKANNEDEVSHQEPIAFYLVEPLDEHKRKEIDKHLLRFIIKDLQPFNIVEQPEFIKFTNMLNPGYALPSRKTLSKKLLPEMYNAIVTELRSSLKDVTAVALALEKWKSISDETFISVTAHYLNKDLELQASILDCIYLHEHYDSDSIASVLKALIIEWELTNKVLAVVTDGCEDTVLAVEKCNWNHVFCFAHILNAVMTAGLEEIKPFLSKVRNITEYFRINSTAFKRFHMIQKQMGLINKCKLKTDVPNKWNTTFDMLTRFEKNKLPLLSTTEQLRLNFLQLSSADFTFLDHVIKLLIVFNTIRVELSSERLVPLSKVPHMIKFMVKHLTSILQQVDLPSQIVNMGNTLKRELKKFEVLEQNEIVCQSVLLDPRFKKRGIPIDVFKEAYLSLHHKVISIREEIMKEKNIENSEQTQQDENLEESEYFVDMWSEFKSIEAAPQQNFTTTAALEIDAFLSDEYLSMESNPLSYWTDISNQNNFPALFELAKRLLCIPATSVSCDRMYSKKGNILQEKKRSLSGSKLKQILFLHYNM